MLHLRDAGLLDLDCITVTGKTVRDNLEWWEGSERRLRFRGLLKELDGVDPDDVIHTPARARAKGMGSTSWDYMATRPWIREGKVKFLYTIGLERDPKIPDVPTIVELAQNEEDRSIFKLLSVAATIGRSPALAPGSPNDRLVELRKAFEATMQDPAFIAEAKKRKVDLEFASGEDIGKAVSDIIAMPKSVVDRYSEVIQPMD